MMQETLRRRLRYLRADTNAPGEEDPASIIEDDDKRDLAVQLRKKEKFHHRPDLLLIDGGKGQLNAVVEVLEELDLWGIPVAGLAKEHEWLFVPGTAEPIVLPPGSPGLHLVMRIRDEAHRFAVEYHRVGRRDQARERRGTRGRQRHDPGARLSREVGAQSVLSPSASRRRPPGIAFEGGRPEVAL
jgi:excinuclease UvrABC nuclease subunit